MAIERLQPYHIDIIHRAFHGEDAPPYCIELMGRCMEMINDSVYAREQRCLYVAALHASAIYEHQPYGQDSADTAIVTALVIMRLCGASIDASKITTFMTNFGKSITTRTMHGY